MSGCLVAVSGATCAVCCFLCFLGDFVDMIVGFLVALARYSVGCLLCFWVTLISLLTLEEFHRCTKDNLLLLANHYNVAVSKHLKKQVVKVELYAALVEMGILPHLQITLKTPERSSQTLDEAVRLKELEVELQRLALKEKELQHLNDLETKTLEQQMKIRLHEFELGVVSQVSANLTEFDVSRNIRLVPPFDEKGVDRYFVMFEWVASTLKWQKRVDFVVAMYPEW